MGVPPSAFIHSGDILLVEWLHNGNEVKDIFNQDEVVYHFKGSYYEPTSAGPGS